jgi:hypothetical protein
MENYINAKKQLDDLLNEDRTLSVNLSAAVAAGDVGEVTRLKGRQRDLPSEIFTAKAMLYKAHIEMLEAEHTADYRELLEAKQNSKNLDSVVSAKIQVLDVEKAKLKNEALSALALPSIIQGRIDRRNKEIWRIRKELSDLLAA